MNESNESGLSAAAADRSFVAHGAIMTLLGLLLGFTPMFAKAPIPEKAGVGGSIPSLATMFSSTYVSAKNAILFHSVPKPKSGSPRFAEKQSGSGSA